MTQNFDAAEEWFSKYTRGKTMQHYDDEAHPIQTIQFALKFTKAALSGEVSENVVQSGLDGDDCIQSFTAMSQQLAKEIG